MSKKVKTRSIKVKYKKRDIIAACCFAGPTFIGLLIFYIIPMFQTVFYSFTEWGMFGGYTFIGTANYERLFQDVTVLIALRNTVTYAILMVPFSMAISIIVASLLNNKIKGVSVYRVIYFLPAVTMTAAIGMIWQWIFNSRYGILNQFIGLFGVEGPSWLTDSNTAMIALVIVGVWSSLSTSIVIYLAGLQGISSSYYEAADIDGASRFRKFIKITLPLLTPTMFFNLVTSLISALQVFDLIFLMFREENPALPSVQSLSFLFYRQAFVFNNRGYGAAIVVILLLLTLVITIVNFTMQKKWVHYS